MSHITGILIIAFTSIATAAVIPSSVTSPLPMDSKTPTLNTQIISDETESTEDVPITDNDTSTESDIPVVEDLKTDLQNNKENKTCDELNCPNPRKVDLEAEEFLKTDLNDTYITHNQNANGDEKKNEVLNKIESALKNAKQSKCFSCLPVSAPLDMVPIFKPRRYIPCENKETDDTNAVNTIPNQINTEIQYSKPLCGCNTVNKENVISSDDLNAILKTKSYPSLGCNDCNTLNLIKPQNTGLNIVTRKYNPGCNCNNRPLKIVKITKTQGNADLNNLGSQKLCQQNIAPASNECDRNKAKIVIFKPEKVVVEESYGEFLKKRTMDVLIPYYVSQLPV